MTLKVDGLNDIFSTIENLKDIGKKASKKAIKVGLNEALEQLKEDAPEDKQKSKNYLAIQNIKVNKDWSAWGSCGIGSNNWNTTKQLWYQNYGYENLGLNFQGERIENNVGWMDKSFEKVKTKAENKMMNTLLTEIDTVLK